MVLIKGVITFKYLFKPLSLGVTQLDDKEFLELLEKSDCIDDLIKMASNPWQKQVVVEFVKMGKRIGIQEHEIGTLKKITWGIFALTAVACVVQVINSIIVPLL